MDVQSYWIDAKIIVEMDTKHSLRQDVTSILL